MSDDRVAVAIAVLAAVAMIVFAALGPAVCSYPWGVHYSFPSWLHKVWAALLVGIYSTILMFLVAGTPNRAGQLLLVAGAPVLALATPVLLWSLWLVITLGISFTLVLAWATFVVAAQTLGLWAGRRLRAMH